MSKPTVVVEGVTEMRRELRKFAPEVLKALDKELRTMSAPIVSDARSLIPEKPPLSGWQVWAGVKNWDTAKAKRGIKVKQGKRSRGGSYSALLQIRNDDAAGSIFSTVGRTNKATNRSGLNFIKVHNERYGSIRFPATRSIWGAVVKYGLDRYQKDILEAYGRAEKELQTRMDRRDVSLR